MGNRAGVSIASLNKANVYVMLGDSNMNGVTIETGIYSQQWGSKNNTYIYFKPDFTKTNNGGIENYNHGQNDVPPNGRNSSPYRHNASTPFAHYINTATRCRNYILKCSKGGSTLIPQSGSEISWAASSSDIWETFSLWMFPQTISAIKSAGFEPNFKGVIIRLGTNDCGSSVYNLTAFKSEIQTLCSNLRTLMPNVPIYWYKVRTDLAVSTLVTDSTKVTAINAALTDCTTFGNGSYIAGLTLIDAGSNPVDLEADGVHFTEVAYNTQGVNDFNYISKT